MEEHAMLDTKDPDDRRELARETSREGMSTAAWAGIAFAVMVIGGIIIYALSGTDPRSSIATQTKAPIERSVPPATTGQGGVQSKMPTVDQKPQTKSSDKPQ
jgi:hypothetical protein